MLQPPRAADMMAAFKRVAPGGLLCAAIAAVAMTLQALEVRLFGRAWIEALVIAILLGALVRNLLRPGRRFDAGVGFSAKQVLEVSIVLLGSGVSAGLLVRAGPQLALGVAVLVIAAVAASYAIGRAMSLPRRLAALIACGNSICGNSAIAAVAPVIGAEEGEIAASIAFTAVLGVAVVLLLPVLAVGLQMTPRAFGVLAGLTVYAVPQVLPATAPVSALAVQMGVLVKLMRVLMLGPVILGFSLFGRSARVGPDALATAPRRASLSRLLPWFIVGFVLMMAARSVGLIGPHLVRTTQQAATLLTIVAMAALGLGVEVRAVARAGLRVTLTVTLSLLAIGGLALLLIAVLGLS